MPFPLFLCQVYWESMVYHHCANPLMLLVGKDLDSRLMVSSKPMQDSVESMDHHQWRKLWTLNSENWGTAIYDIGALLWGKHASNETLASLERVLKGLSLLPVRGISEGRLPRREHSTPDQSSWAQRRSNDSVPPVQRLRPPRTLLGLKATYP